MIDCKSLYLKHIDRLKQIAQDINKTFAIIQVGDNPASSTYVRHKLSDCEKVGIKTKLYKYDNEISQEQLENSIKEILHFAKPNAMMIQLPLPNHIDKETILNLIPPEIDVDGLGKNSLFTPCTPKGVMMLLDDLNVNVKGACATVIGRSKLVGQPLINLLIEKQATVCSLNSATKEEYFNELVQHADIVVSAVGEMNLLDSKLIGSHHPNQIVIDIGINYDDNGKLCGDCNKELYDKVDMITPVPNGMGLYTRIALLDNILKGE